VTEFGAGGVTLKAEGKITQKFIISSFTYRFKFNKEENALINENKYV
jgi:hypothetical protein